ncbi:efflux RND transporter periplasmic adaptor subunit [Desulfobacterales bacterium HSG16]|nr:efflux RND transporter periplasmic adaptor subunit [Desulfobacterales bacterium HSG16]
MKNNKENKKNKENKTEKSAFPIKPVVLTAVIVLILAGAAGFIIGSRMPGIGIGGHVGNVPQVLEGEDAEATLFTCGMHPWIIVEEPGDCPICGMKLTPKRDKKETDQEKGERRIAYWRAPMNPEEIYDQPGKSAMGMDLVPVYEDEIIAGVEIKIDPVTRQNMGIRTAQVRTEPLLHTIRTYGHITYDETRTARISSKFNGWFEKLYVDFTGQKVKIGDPLFEIYSPQLLAAQEEYLVAFKNFRQRGRGEKQLLDSVRRRLIYFDVGEEEIEAIEKAGKVKKTVLMRSPYEGVITHKNADKGGFVKTGTDIYTIADLSRVWVEAHIYEYELGWVELGQEAEMTLPFISDKIFSGKVTYIYPWLEARTRDVVLRLEFDNSDFLLKPDMYSDVRIKTSGKKKGMIIPSEAVIRSGERNIVFAAHKKGMFTPREVKLGMSVDNGNVHVLSGLAPGEMVVTSGQFMLDSESKLKEAVQKMLEAKSKGKEDPEKPNEDDFFSDMEETKEKEQEDDFFKDME